MKYGIYITFMLYLYTISYEKGIKHAVTYIRDMWTTPANEVVKPLVKPIPWLLSRNRKTSR